MASTSSVVALRLEQWRTLEHWCWAGLSHLVPYRSATYHRQLLRSMGRNRVRAYGLACLLLYHSGHFLYLQARTLDFESRLLHADYVHFVLVPQAYVSFSIIALLAGYFYLVFHLRPDDRLRVLCCWLATEEENPTNKPNETEFISGANRYGLSLLRALQPFLVVIEFSVLYAHYRCWPHMVRLYLLGPNEPNIGRVIIHLTNTLLNDVALFAFCQISVVTTSVGTTLFGYLFMRLRHNLRYLKRWSKVGRRFHSCLQQHLALGRFIRHDLRNLGLLFLMDRSMGQWFLTFMLLSAPSNAYLFVLSLVVRMNLVQHFLVGAIIAYQLVAIAGMHLELAYFTQVVHRSARPLLKMAVAQRHQRRRRRLKSKVKVNSFHAHFRLAITVERLHNTQRKYGVHYGSFGLISMFSFAKLLLLYGKLLIYSYKLILVDH